MPARAGEKGEQPVVLLYVTFCPNPRLCVSAARLKTFTDLPGVTVRTDRRPGEQESGGGA